MRTLSAALLEEQKKDIRRPLIKLEVASYEHPAAAASVDLQWSDLFWECLVLDSTEVSRHAVAMPADGSICRVRQAAASGKLYYQRVTSPSAASDWTSWTDWDAAPAATFVGMAAMGTEVIAFCHDNVYLYYKQSTNSGATFGSWTVMMNTRPCEMGCAAAFKANGDLAVVHASDVNDPTSLYIQIRTGSTWSTGLGQISGDFAIYGLALYHKDDWNIIALMLEGTTLRLARGVYGDGGSYTAGTWSGWEFINSSRASINYGSIMKLRRYKTGRQGKSSPTYYEQMSVILQQQAVDSLGVQAPFAAYNAAFGAFHSFAKNNVPWFFRLRTGTAFAVSDWSRAWPLEATATYGLAVCSDGTYIYASAPNQVWRSTAPSWAPPTPGAGAGTNYAILNAHVLGVKEQVDALSPGHLDVTLDNSSGAYSSIGGGAASAVGKLKLGAQVTLSIGYRTSSDLLSVAGKYYVESLEYNRAPGQSHLVIHAVDAWALLQRFAFNRPAEWNAITDDYSVYDIIELVVQSVGGTLSYVSRSTDITGTYPHITVSTGENAAAVLRQLLDLVPDVIYFDGLTGYIVYPLAADAASYELRFPL